MGVTSLRTAVGFICGWFALATFGAEHVGPKEWAQMRLESVGVGAIPRGVVASIAQDRSGHLWLATGDGLVRYDGYRFKSQETSDPDPIERNLGWIRALFAGSDGKVWIWY